MEEVNDEEESDDDKPIAAPLQDEEGISPEKCQPLNLDQAVNPVISTNCGPHATEKQNYYHLIFYQN